MMKTTITNATKRPAETWMPNMGPPFDPYAARGVDGLDVDGEIPDPQHAHLRTGRDRARGRHRLPQLAVNENRPFGLARLLDHADLPAQALDSGREGREPRLDRQPRREEAER